MGETVVLNFEPEAPPPDRRSEPPQVFVRTFVAPPGAPWTQARAAGLEARHGAPLPITDLMHRLKRLEAWFPGRPARFAVFYIRRSDYQAPFETVVDVDGEALRVAFGSTPQDFRRLRGLALIGLGAAISIAMIGWGAIAGLNARAEADARLDTLARHAATRLAQGRQVAAQRSLGQAIERVRGDTGAPDDVIDDLDWLAHARTADAQILAVHWDHGLLAVEARGEAAPVFATDRDVIRSPRPIRSGVWLWGIRRRPADAAPAYGPRP